LVRKSLRFCEAGALACQLIFSHLLSPVGGAKTNPKGTENKAFDFSVP
jgi:hypothetical protein